MKLPQIILILFATIFFANCGVKEHQSNSQPISHAAWDSLLQKYVTKDGQVNYKGFVQDSVPFKKYLTLLSNNHPNKKNWSKDERLAYWINAYNAFTVELIRRNYPVKTIKDLGGKIYKINTPWDIRFIYIEGADYDLNNIEHDILRKEFNEPRIHFAVNCASVSCPRLRNEAFVAERIEEQLTDQAKYFLNNPVKNIIAPDELKLSKIFSWFKGDFTDNGSLIDFLNLYAPVKINADASRSSMDYDWNLNE